MTQQQMVEIAKEMLEEISNVYPKINSRMFTKNGNRNSLEELIVIMVYFGKIANVKFTNKYKLSDFNPNVPKKTCPRCNGKGASNKWKYTGYTCYHCEGHKTVLASIPSFRLEQKEEAQNIFDRYTQAIKELEKQA